MQLVEGSIIAEQYQLLKQLGHGSFGDVWLAHNMLADIDVAVKFYGTLDQKGIDDFRNEFKIAYQLRHPNLLNINHFDVYENCPYLVMPYCANGSVNRLVGQMPEQEIWKFILDVSSGLAFLHSQQPPIVHQDIKPDNILITSDGRYVISDFGISRSFRTKMSRTNNTSSSGTIAYMGPERFSEKPMVVLASDIWAFGMTIYELMTGDVLWEGMGGCVQLNGARIPDIRGNFSPELAKLVTSCLAAETWNRPTAVQINEYATAWLQHRAMPLLPTQNITPDYTPAPAPVPAPEPEPQRIVHINKPADKSKAYTPQTGSGDNSILKRAALIAAAAIFGILLITGGYMYISMINEQQDYVSCKTIQDYEQFIKDHPNSSYVEEARHHISSMSNTTAPQSLMQTTHPETPQQVEHTKNPSHTKTIYVTEKENHNKKHLSPTPNRSRMSDDQAFYRCVTARDYDAYLRNYPNGRHRKEASKALSALAGHASPNNQYSIEDVGSNRSSGSFRVVGGGESHFSTGTSVRMQGGSIGGGSPRGGSFGGGGSRGGSFGGGASRGGGPRSGSSRGSGSGSSNRHSH